MSTERIIHLADLAFIENSLRTLRSDIGTVSNQVENVGQEVVNTRSELARLEQAFLDFVAADAKAKEVALAETSESPRVLWRLRDLSAGVFGLRGELLIIPILSLGGWDVSDGLKESLVIEPGHPFEGGQFEGLHCFPGRPAVD